MSANDFTAGVLALRRAPLVGRVTCAAASANFGLGMMQAVLLLFAYRGLGLTAGVVGICLAMGGFGALVGAALATGIARRAELQTVLWLSTLAIAGGSLVIALAAVAAPVIFFCVGLTVRSFVGPVWSVSSSTLRQLAVPMELQGRVMAASRAVTMLTPPLGALAGGLVGAWFVGATGPASGYALTLVIGALVVIGSSVAFLDRSVRSHPFSRARRLRAT